VTATAATLRVKMSEAGTVQWLCVPAHVPLTLAQIAFEQSTVAERVDFGAMRYPGGHVELSATASGAHPCDVEMLHG
jgi:hypothetical protein